MLVYHGGSAPIKEIELQKCRPYTDFGRGFYVTKYKIHAENWARRSGKHRNNGFVTTFNYIERKLQIISVKKRNLTGIQMNGWILLSLTEMKNQLNSLIIMT